jgi:quinolinate synthase
MTPPPAMLEPPRFTRTDIDQEARRLAARIRQPDRWDLDACRLVAPLTLEIQDLKRRRNAVILAHSYQTPDIVYGVADHVGDSYGLSKKARESDADVIVFSSVRFMGETAKIVNPGKTVLLPEPSAGCSLADGVTPEDVRRYRRLHPRAAVVAYVNTSAEVKALSDVCVTSANYLTICERLPQDEIVFLPDKYMGLHLRNALQGRKRVVVHDAACIVHEGFKPESARAWRDEAAATGRKLIILAHPECAPNVLEEADFVGSTEAMMDYARRLEAQGRVDVMPITECGTADRMKAELPGLHVWGACSQCPFMKDVSLAKILQVLRAPRPDQAVEIDSRVLREARRSLDRMFELAA